MKNWLFAVLLILAAAPADAQFFKKKKKPQPDSTAAAVIARKQPVSKEPEYGNQQLSVDDLLDIMDRRDDSGYVRSLLVKAGFNRHAKGEKNQIVFMGDTATGVTKYTEMVLLQSDTAEIQLLQWCTRHPENYEGIRRALRSERRFTGTPILTEDGEVSEAFYTRDYNLLIESVNKKSKWIISIWLRGARL
ncbi:MAG: hypothetical protein EOO15_23805 [Chitinophagaceae bacterium]|nr:MAG: hypothetical protein EOO15_23805 [Chitinophagaceae bacterium]